MGAPASGPESHTDAHAVRAMQALATLAAGGKAFVRMNDGYYKRITLAVLAAFVLFGRPRVGPEGRGLDDLATEVDVGQPEAAADDATITEDTT